MKKNEIIAAVDKIVKIINSCETMEQLDMVVNWVDYQYERLKKETKHNYKLLEKVIIIDDEKYKKYKQFQCEVLNDYANNFVEICKYYYKHPEEHDNMISSLFPNESSPYTLRAAIANMSSDKLKIFITKILGC